MLLLTILKGGKIDTVLGSGVHYQYRQFDITQPLLTTTLHDKNAIIRNLLND